MKLLCSYENVLRISSLNSIVIREYILCENSIPKCESMESIFSGVSFVKPFNDVVDKAKVSLANESHSDNEIEFLNNLIDDFRKLFTMY